MTLLTCNSPLQKPLQNLSPWSVEFRVILENKTLWLWGQGSARRLESGRVLFYGYVQDISTRKLRATPPKDLSTSIPLQNQPQFLSAYTHKIHQATFISDSTGKITWFSEILIYFST